MRPQKVEDEDLIIGLMAVLRSKGYEGSSLNDLANAAGLQKASLYYRFPAGKEEIAIAVLSYVRDWVENNIYLVLMDKAVAPAIRLQVVVKNIRALYADGEKSCVLSALSMESSVHIFSNKIKTVMELWIQGFTELGIDFGFSKAVATEMAMDVVIAVEGSLILAKGIGNTSPFTRVLTNITNRYRRK